jgi:hypothetical protein
MNERATAVALALAAIAACYVLVVPKPQPRQAPWARPLSTETKPDGLAAAARWIASGGIPVMALKGRYDTLATLTASKRGNVLISHVPFLVPTWKAEREALIRWVERGNTLVIAAALADTPGWSAPGQSVSEPFEDLNALAAIDPRPSGEAIRLGTDVRPDVALPEAQYTELAPVSHPFFAGVKSVSAVSDFPAQGWVAADPSHPAGPLLVLGHTGPGALTGDALWVQAHGQGRIIVATVGSVFANRVLGRTDNGRFLANLVTVNLAPGGAVIFDDTHQGAHTMYDARALFSDSRFYLTCLVLIGIWFAWVLGSQRLSVAPSPPPAPGELSLAEGAAALLERTVPQPAAMRLMIDRFRRRHAPLGVGSDDWGWLESAAMRAPAAVATLRAADAALKNDRHVRLKDLRQAITGLEEVLQ